jgi:glycosyltransferase involved in cell wall biosynthesis
MKNTFIPKFTYVIPFRYKPDRIISLKRVVEWVSGFNGIEILIIEQDKHSKIENLNLKGRHIFVESDLPFNKAWAYNIAIKRTQSPVLVFGDADVIMHPNDLIESLKALDSYDCVIPNSNLVQLSPPESSADIQSILNLKRTSPKMNLTDGISIFKRTAIEKIGGWNEDILGPGFINRFQDMKMKRMLNFKQMEFHAFHLFHRPEFPDKGLVERNSKIIEHYSNPMSDLQSHIQTTVPKSGYLNKYQF